MLKKLKHFKTLLLIITLTTLTAVCAGCSDSTAQDDLWGRSNAKEIDINSKISGRVVELMVDEGDTVKAGQVIARIDARDIEAQVAAANANILALQSSLNQAQAQKDMQLGTSNAAVNQAAASVYSAKTNLDLAEVDYKRYAELVEQGAVSRQTYDSYKAKYDTALATYEQAQAALASSQSSLTITDVNSANEEATKSKIEQAIAALEQIQVSMDETYIRAPFDGVITEKYVEEGSIISTGTPLYAIQDPNDNWVDFKVPETQLNDFDLNQALTVEARDGETRYTGTITYISQKSEFATQRATSERGDASDIITYNVKVEINSPKIRPGMRFRIVK